MFCCQFCESIKQARVIVFNARDVSPEMTDLTIILFIMLLKIWRKFCCKVTAYFSTQEFRESANTVPNFR